MPITFFSPSLVRVVRHPRNDTEHTITIPQTSVPERPLPTAGEALSSSSIAPSSHIIGAISCPRDTLPYILLLTSDAFLYKIPLTRPNIDVSCICNGTNNTTRRFQRDRLCDDVPGVLYSITAIPGSSTQRERDSHVLIHGSFGNILFSPHSPRRQVLNVSTTSATVATGSLLNGVVAYASYVDHVKAFVCASVTGVVSVCRTSFDKFQKASIDGHGTTGAHHQSMQTVAQMFQRPLCMLSTIARDVVVVVGINGDVVVVYVGSSNGKKQLCTKRTFIEFPDDDNDVVSGGYVRAEPIGQHSLSISVRSAGNDASLKVEYNSDTYCLTVAVTDIRSKPVASDDIIDVDRVSAFDDGIVPKGSLDLAKYRRDNESDEKIGMVLKQLLSDIERIGFSYTTACMRRTELHRQLRSYNAALTFASVARHHCQDSTKPLAVECQFSLHLTPTRTGGFVEFEHEHKMPVHGRAVFLSIALCNRTDVALADGWGLHVQVAQTQAVKNLEATLCEMRAELRQVIDPRGGRAVMCFPLTLQSHSPLSISTYLRFKQVSVSGSSPILKTTTNNDTVDVRLTLCRNARVDILHMSTLADAKAIKEKDKSHKWVSSVARSVADASLKNVRSVGGRRADSERTKNHPIVHRFQVPLDRRRLYRLLRSAMAMLHAESDNLAFKTILDGRFSLSLDDHNFSSSIEQQPQHPGFHPCNVTIHGLGHIVPFVRAAITHRVIEDLSTTTVPFDIQIHGATHISAWHKRLLDMTDEYTTDVRDSQASLVAVVRVLRAIALQQNDTHPRGAVQILDDANDECDAMVKALTATCRMWDRWRHALEELWSPRGMKYTERAPTPVVVNVDR